MSQAFAAVKAGEESLLCRSYSRYPLAIVRGKGARLWDVDGKEYVDLLGGIAVTALGHCNDEICAALEAQSHKIWHVSNLFYQEEQLELANQKAEFFESVINVLKNDYGVSVVKKRPGKCSRKVRPQK